MAYDSVSRGSIKKRDLSLFPPSGACKLIVYLEWGSIFSMTAVAAVIGGVTALYLWVTALFGSLVNNWQQAVHVELASFFSLVWSWSASISGLL